MRDVDKLRGDEIDRISDPEKDRRQERFKTDHHQRSVVAMHPPIGFASTVKVRSDPFWQALPIEELLHQGDEPEDQLSDSDITKFKHNRTSILLGSIGNYYG